MSDSASLCAAVLVASNLNSRSITVRCDWCALQAPRQAFASTGHTLRLMEAMAAAVHQQEPLLLTGETGTGKTTLVQQLASKVPTRFAVQP